MVCSEHSARPACHRAQARPLPAILATIGALIFAPVIMASTNPVAFFEVTAPTHLVTTGAIGDITIAAKDLYGATVSNYLGTVIITSHSTADVAVLVGPYVFTPGDNGVATINNALKYNRAGVPPISVVDSSLNVASEMNSVLAVNGFSPAGPAASYAIYGYRDPVFTGAWNSIKLAVLDKRFRVVTSYAGTVIFDCTAPGTLLPTNGVGQYTFTPGDAGFHCFSNDFQFAVIGEHSLTAHDAVLPAIAGRQDHLTAMGYGQSTVVTHLVLGRMANPAALFSKSDVDVELRNIFNQRVTNFAGWVSITSSDPAFVPPADHNFTIPEAGCHFTNIEWRTPGLHWLKATTLSNTNVYGIESNIVVSTGDNGSFVVDIEPALIAGQWHTLAITAVDDGGRPDTNYVGMVQFDAWDHDGPSTIDFSSDTFFGSADHGRKVIPNGIRIRQPGTARFSFCDQAFPGRRNYVSTEAYASGGGTTTHFRVQILDQPVLAQDQHGMVIIAMDDNDLVNTNHIAAVSNYSISASFALNPCSLFTNGIAILRDTYRPSAAGTASVRVALATDTNVFGEAKECVSMPSTRYFVNTNGDNFAGGTNPATAFRTISRAAQIATPGDVIVVMPGRYFDNIIVTNSGTFSQYVTFIGDRCGRFAGRTGPVTVKSAGLPIFAATNKSYVQIAGFDLVGSNNVCNGINAYVSPYWRIIDNYFAGWARAVNMTVASESYVGRNIFMGNWDSIYLDWGAATAIIDNNHIMDCDNGVTIAQSTNCMVVNNIIANNWGTGIQFLNDARGTILDNYLNSNLFTAITINSAGSGADIRQNIILNNPGPAVRFNNSPGPNTFYFNTCVNNREGAQCINASATDIRNNIFVSNQFGIDCPLGPPPSNDYNCYFNNATNHGGFAALKPNEIVADPRFAGGGDFHLQSAAGRPGLFGLVNDPWFSPCIDAGDPAVTPVTEPRPNGGRVNIGKYGNIPGASHSPILSVVSAHGAPMPPTGIADPGLNSSIACYMTSSPEPFGASTQFMCTGWTNGMGIIPAAGATTNAGVFPLTQVSGIEWTWQTQMLVTVIPPVNGDINPGSGWYPADNVLTFIPTPSNGYQFAGWTGDVPVARTNDNPLVLTNTRTRVIGVNFENILYTIIATAGVNGVIKPSGNVRVSHGNNTNFTITPNPGYQITNMLVDGGVVTPTNQWLFVNVTNNHSIEAYFALRTYPVTVVQSPNGTIAPGGTNWVGHGSNLTFILTPTTNYLVANVVVDATSYGPQGVFVLTNVTAPHVVTAAFTLIKYPLTIQSLRRVTVPPVGTAFHPWNTPITASVTSSPVFFGPTQYLCTGWTRIGSAPGSGPQTNVFFNVITNTVHRWNWATQYLLNITAGPNGTVSGSPNGFYPAGASGITLTAIPSNGYYFVNWMGAPVPANPILNLVMNRPFILTANFAPDVGSVRVFIIEPASAIINPRWRLTTGVNTNWQPSGATIQVPPGTYAVTFTPVVGWTRPADIANAKVLLNQTTIINVTYPRGKMAFIPRSTFRMGIYNGAGGHSVTLRPYFIDQREITIREFSNFTRATGHPMPSQPSAWAANSNLPVVNVTWGDAAAYAAWSGKRLPTEAEWEFAARGGMANALYPWGDSISSANANFGRPAGTPTVAGTYPPTGRGLFDIAGNVWEWCNDWYTSQLPGPVTNPVGPATGTYRCARGGSFAGSSLSLQCALRYYYAPGVRYKDLGFRCAVSAHPASDGIVTVITTNLLTITGMRVNSGGTGFTITWDSQPGRIYAVERCINFEEGFLPIATGLPATPPTNTYTDTPAAVGTCLYRIRESL